MAIYRPPKPRWRVAVGAGLAGLLVGAVAGFAAGDKEPDPLEGARALQVDLTRAAGPLEVVAIEYEEAVPAGEVVAEAEYQGGLAALRSSRGRFEEVREALSVFDPARTDEIAAGYDELQRLMESHADPEDVRALTEELRDLLAPDV